MQGLLQLGWPEREPRGRTYRDTAERSSFLRVYKLGGIRIDVRGHPCVNFADGLKVRKSVALFQDSGLHNRLYGRIVLTCEAE